MSSLLAQTSHDNQAAVPPSDAAPSAPFWVSVQANFITQYHPAFYAPYSGPNSLSPAGEHATSRVLTLYTGVRIQPTTELLLDVESAGGAGLGSALGLAGFTNLDVVRNPTLGSAPYIARAMIHQTIPLSSRFVQAVRGPLGLASSVAERRLEIHAGKLSTVDFFDVNSVGSDSHLQFMNWTLANNGAYDYAADTRGYTYGVVAEYFDRGWAMRFGEMLMPKVANGLDLEWNLGRARAENAEIEFHPTLIPGKQSGLRLLGFVNHANMGNYREAIDDYLRLAGPVPDITAHPFQTRLKHGFGVNAEQELTSQARAFGRFSWNDGKNESYAYTEVDRAFSGGADLRGARWHRQQDKAGVAVSVNAISEDHRRYLALGGLGFLLGDGALRYGGEKILEAYYTAHAWRGLTFAVDVQRVWNPGYNQDRGPLTVISLRCHVEDSVPFGGRAARN